MLGTGSSCRGDGARRHHRDQVRAVLRRAVQVAVEMVRGDLDRLRRIRREALRQRVLRSPWREARATRRRSPRRARRPPSARRTRRPARSATPAAGTSRTRPSSGPGKLTAVMISSGCERGLVHALEEVVGRDLALVGVDRRAERQHRRRIVGGRDRCWRASRRSCPGCAPAGRRCRRPASASAGIACLTAADAATSACVVIAPITIASPSFLMPFSSAMPPRSTSVPGLARRSFIAPTRLWPPASALPPVFASAAAASATDFGALVVECVHDSSPLRSVLRADWIACHTRCGVAGMSMSLTPTAASASCTAFISAGGAPIAPASPQPLTPSGLCVHGVTLVATLNVGRSSARGIA